MKTRTLTQTFVIALAMMVTLTIGSSKAFAQDKDDKQSADSLTVEQSKTVDKEGHGNTLVGVWEEVAPAFVDCQTREPGGPTIRVLLTFNQGGTMYVEDTFPLEGPYRSTGGGIWKRTSGRNYTYVNVHYSFDPDKTFTFIIKVRANITLSRDGNSFTENGTVEVIDQTSGNVVFNGCYASTAHRLTF
ncbi:MAG: hypothetical protein LC775_08950 [Acidobacteria bacterium]|nr:hypothetical protein [Acidobacteriota bacterium]